MKDLMFLRCIRLGRWMVEITSESHPLQVDFIQEMKGVITGGLLGMTHAPGKKEPPLGGETTIRDLTLDLQALTSQYHTHSLVTLNEAHEFSELQIPLLLSCVEEHGMKSIHYPIKDYNVPSASMADFVVFIDSIVASIRKENIVVIHCKAGKGRTGLVVACCLVRMGANSQKAIKVVRDTRRGTIQTWLQEKFISNFEKHLQGKT